MNNSSFQEQELQEGSQFLGYKIIKKIGSGGVGNVYLVKKQQKQENNSSKGDIQDTELICMKQISKKKIDQNHIDNQKWLLQINHPNVCCYRGQIEQTKENYYIFSEYCDQGDLNDYIQNRYKQNNPLSEDEAIELFKQILRGMQYLQSLKITEDFVHRDLKPQNIFLKKEQQGLVLKIADFDFSKFISHDKRRYSKEIGTQKFMAPEIKSGKEYNYKTDVYSLGIILYCILHGELPGGKNQRNISESLKNEIEYMTKNEPGIRRSFQQVYQYFNCTEYVRNINCLILSFQQESIEEFFQKILKQKVSIHLQEMQREYCLNFYKDESFSNNILMSRHHFFDPQITKKQHVIIFILGEISQHWEQEIHDIRKITESKKYFLYNLSIFYIANLLNLPKFTLKTHQNEQLINFQFNSSPEQNQINISEFEKKFTSFIDEQTPHLFQIEKEDTKSYKLSILKTKKSQQNGNCC